MNLSSIEHKLSSVAFNLFRDWVINASELYPDHDFSIVSEQVLVEDLKDTLTVGLNSLFEPEHNIKRLTPGWEIGFLFGFIEGNLGGHWFNEYIRKRSDEYKQIMILDAIKIYINNDELANLSITHIYKDLLSSDCNLNNINFTLPNIEFDIKKLRVSSSLDEMGHTELITGCIDTLRLKKIMDFVKQKQPDIMPDLECFFSDDELKKLISENDEPLQKQETI